MKEVVKSFRRIALLVTVLISANLQAQTQLSERAEVAIITVGPYQGEVWSAFGHSGIRISDPATKTDLFFDYGLFDFEQDNFFLNFAKGLLNYKVGARDYQRFVAVQKYLNRYVKAQYLNFTQEEKQQLYDFLLNNVKPENAEYLYNYVYDNCATKLRDIPNELFPDRISFDLSYKEEGKTVRNLMDDYLSLQPWGDLGIDLGLGQQIDKEAPAEVYMFLPEYIFKAYAGATIDRDSLSVSLVKKTEIVFNPKPEEQKNGILTPLNAFIILFFIVGFITNRNFKTGKRTKWIDVFIFSLAGFVGLWVAFLWFGTEHLSKWNLNILWAIPLHLPIAFFISKEKFRKFMKPYFKVIGIWYSVLLVVWAILPQPLHMSLVPFVLAMVLRAFYINYDLGRVKSVPVVEDKK